jgi:hypothetical protein
MTNKERQVQKALGTLSIKGWLQEKGIVLREKWWYFPLKKSTPADNKNVVIINNQKYYKVADEYIDQFVFPISSVNEVIAEQVIESVYWSISIENGSNIC